jgi:hypothetical protein
MIPLDAVSLAANVVQFVGFGLDILSKANRIYKDGSLVEYKDVKNINTDLSNLTTRLRDGLVKCSTPPAEEEALQDICTGCLDVSEQMDCALPKLQLNGSASKWKSVRKAFKAVWGKEKLNELKARLDSYGQQMDRRVLVAIR